MTERKIKLEDIFAVLDVSRQERHGIPEIILAEGKTTPQIIQIASTFIKYNGQALISRLSSLKKRQLIEHFQNNMDILDYSHSMAIRSHGFSPDSLDAKVELICAGTSDVAAIKEAQMVIEACGIKTYLFYDVGIAGIHRLEEPLKFIYEENIDVVVVAAGMDGALPTVVSAIIDRPVIGLPVSRGYGLGGNGKAALMTMLQTCSPGLTVVNIDNGIGAGAAAVLTARRIASRASSQRPNVHDA